MLSKFRSRVSDSMAECPSFDELLSVVFGDIAILYSEEERAELISYLWELFGYVIYPQKNVPVFMFWVGSEDSGVLQVFDVLKQLVGYDAVFEGEAKSILGKGANKSNSAEKLESKLLFVDGHVKPGTKVCDGLLKTFSETKRISVFPARGTDRLADTTATPLLCMDSDHLRFTDDSYAFSRRTHAIYFDSTVDIDRAELLTRIAIRDEMPGVLNKALNGLGRVKERYALAEPASAVDFRKRFLDIAVISRTRTPGLDRRLEAKL